MANARRVSTRLAFFAGGLGFAVFLKNRGGVALAAAPGGSGIPYMGGNLLILAGAALVAVLALFSCGLIAAAWGGRSAAGFLRRAERASGGAPMAVAVVAVPDLARLPAAKGRRAMECLRLYLGGFVREGELFGRLDRFSYGILLAAGDGAAFSQRLEVLKQDVGFLYMAAYPGMRIAARVTVCRESGQGLKAALRRARTGGGAPEGPDQGQI